MKKNTETLLVVSKEIGLEVNVDKTKHTVKSRDQDAGRSHNMETDNSSFERVKEFKYLGTTLTNQIFIQGEIKSRFISGNVCYHSVKNILSSSLLSKNINIKTCRTIILPVVLYGCETWSLTLREERKCRKLHNEELSDLFSSPNIVRVIKSGRMR